MIVTRCLITALLITDNFSLCKQIAIDVRAERHETRF